MNILGVQMQDKTALIIGGVGLILLYWAGKKAAGTISNAVDLINPTSSGNIAYQGVNSVGAVISGDQDFSLGSWIWDVLHPSGRIDLPTTGVKGDGGAFGGHGASEGW
jgi:hypothetical protein